MTGVSSPSTGVPPHTRDGTPAHLDPAHSADGLAAIEFDAVLDVVAGFTAGPLGADAIRALRPASDIEWIRHELSEVGELLALIGRGERFDVAPIPPLRTVLGRLRIDGSVLDIAELAAVKMTLAAARIIGDELARHRMACPLVAGRHVAPVHRAIERTLELAVGDDGELLDTASPALASARRDVHAARERLVRRLETLLRDLDASSVGAGATVTMRSGRYVIPIRRDSRQRPEGIIHDESASAGTLFVEPTAAIDLGNALRSAVVAEERAVLAVLRDLTQRLRPIEPLLAAHHDCCVAIDSLVARARWAYNANASVPTIHPAGGALRLNVARHPLLIAKGIVAVPFDLTLDAGEHTLLISGPNTGGKTVLLKTVGLAIALAQSGLVPPVGPDSIIPMIDRLFVDIGDHQSLAADLSTFAAHVASVRQILDYSERGTLVLLDEIGSGTDPAEGGALAAAVLESLTSRGALTLATTHLGALKLLATRVDGVVNGSLHFDAETLSPTFRFAKGIPGRSYGLAIARRLGVSSEVLRNAERLVPEAERNLDQLLATVEARRQALDADEATFRERLDEIERREATLEATQAAQHARDAALRAAEKTAERDRARAAKAYLLEARKQVEAALALARGAADETAAKDARRLVEEGIRDQRARLDESDPTIDGSDETLQVGDRVRLNTGATGELAEIRGDGKGVVLVGTMRLVVATGTLTRVAGAAPRPRVAAVRVDESAPAGAYELDLRGMRADEAEAAVALAIDRATLAEQPHLAIIHGMGTGVLRDVVRRLLAADRRVASFDFAPRTQGGVGVTVAVLR
jgi:DNA mismatch repair protein MutS2